VRAEASCGFTFLRAEVCDGAAPVSSLASHESSYPGAVQLFVERGLAHV